MRESINRKMDKINIALEEKISRRQFNRGKH
jgi:hypothetical protein